MSTPYAPQPAEHTAPVPPLDLTPPAAPKPRFPMWARFVATGVGGLILGAAMSGGGDGADATTATPGETTTVTAPADTTALAAMTAERDAAVKRAEAAEAASAQKDADAAAAAAAAEAPAGIVNGQYVVGTDLEAGRYSMTVEVGGLGYVDQQNGDDYLAQEVANEGERIVVDIANVPGSIVTFKDVTGITKIG